jgi:phospholipase C
MKTENTKAKNPRPLSIDRRRFLKLIGVPALAATMPDNIAKLLAAPSHHRTGTMNDVEHVIILMQENRSFDHYFGTLQGVRGFADPRVMQTPSGQPVWQQPDNGGYVLPFRPPVDNLGLTFLPDPPHGWRDGHSAWNEGKFDQWIANKGVVTMTYHRRSDIPYHAALADAFTVCDAYHCSVMGPTDPNRYHLWTGWLGNNGTEGPNGDPTTGEGPVITNAELGYAWSTYPERLQRNGISWKVYQDTGVGLTADGYWGWTGDKPFIGNYGDNSLLYFHQYQNAPDGSPLALGARTGTTIFNLNQDPARLIDIFREDVRRGQLPQVSWIVAPEAYSEHPNWAPNWGAWYISQFIDILAENPELWSKTVLFLNYDEEGGFFDHIVPPTPPMSPAHGASTVSTAEEIFPGAEGDMSGPYGLGLRVPMIVISPWSKGGFVNSQVFDHTSVIKFLEARFGQGNPDLIEANITEWRRSVVGDLTSAFDFARPEAWRRIALPPTNGYLPDFQRHDDYPVAAPADQTVPAQEPGVRPARALPYDLDATGSVEGNHFQIEFSNVGAATAVFQARSGNPTDLPRCYTVEPGASLAGTWPLTANSAYDVSVHGPNGFFRSFKGGVLTGSAQLAIETFENGRRDDEIFEGGRSKVMSLSITNHSGRRVTVRVFDRYTRKTVKQVLANGARTSSRWSLERFGGWYELVVTVDEDNLFEYRLAGHIEDGKDSISDPLMGGLV